MAYARTIPMPIVGRSLRPAYGPIALRIGQKLRDIYAPPESEPLPAEHVELLLRLRHKERDREKKGA